MARTRCCANECTHGAYTCPRTATERRTTPDAATPYLRATGTAHVHPHARRATGATGARTEERATTETTVCHASGMTMRQTTSARAGSVPMRGPDLAQLSRRRTPRTQEESLVSSIACVATRRPGATRYGDHTRFICVYECTHGAYTWPRLAIERRSTPAAADATPCLARHGYSARPSSREARYRRAD